MLESSFLCLIREKYWQFHLHFFGADNDKTIAHFDPAIAAIQTDRLSQLEWYQQSSDGEYVNERGMSLICNGRFFLAVSHVTAETQTSRKWVRCVE